MFSGERFDVVSRCDGGQESADQAEVAHSDLRDVLLPRVLRDDLSTRWC